MRSKIREAAATDRQRLLALAPRLLEGVAPWRPRHAVLDAVTEWVRSALDDLANDDQMVLVAEYDNSIAGFVHVNETQHWAGQTDAYIGELVVAPEFEGRGIGSELVQAAIDWSRARGLERITLATGVRNSRARRLYASLGFEEEGVTLCAPIQGTGSAERAMSTRRGSGGRCGVENDGIEDSFELNRAHLTE